MEQRLARDSPVPLYHQLAEAIRWRISTGELAAGEQLPTVREAAAELGINFHTVRRAYQELAQDGLVQSNGSRGTWVLDRATPETDRRAVELDRFLDQISREARERFALDPGELGQLLAERVHETATPVVHVLECSDSQCRDHVEEIERRWRVDARPWSLERSGEPPPGLLVATYFHYAEIQRRWPHRRGDLRFVPVHVDPALSHRLMGHGRLLACELDEDRARNLKADLEALFPPGAVQVESVVVAVAGDALRGETGTALVCFAPHAYAGLTADEKEHPRAVKVRYVIEERSLEDLGPGLGWHGG